MAPEPFFLQTPSGERFCLYSHPSGEIRGSVLYIPPFAEEMNRSRRVAALVACALADAGFGVLRIDPAGCGDSAGEFAEASWEGWSGDVAEGFAWLGTRCPGRRWIMGLRGGALLGSAALAGGLEADAFLAIQPVLSGELLLRQFLRIRVAARLGDSNRVGVDGLRAELDAGRCVDVAGYVICPSLTRGLAEARLDFAERPVPRVVCLEVAPAGATGMSPAFADALERWRGQGCRVEGRVLTGAPFWQTPEPVEMPGLAEAVVATVAGA